MVNKKKRTIKKRIHDAEVQLEELKRRDRQQSLSNALDEDLVPLGDIPEFKKLQRESGTIAKAMKIASQHDAESLLVPLEQLSGSLLASMRGLVDEDRMSEADAGGGNEA